MYEIEKYISGETRPLFDACMAYRHFFLLWMYKHFHLSCIEASDLFNDTLILLCKRISEGKITNTRCCMLTLLINLGSGLAIDAMRKHDTQNENKDSFVYETSDTLEDTTGSELTHQLILSCYEKYLRILSCLDRDILIDKFIFCLSTNAIREKYGLPGNEDVRQRICRARRAIIAKFGQDWRKHTET
jgi:DNA-directed RNA polymerase specialized sigma24 family protein